MSDIDIIRKLEEIKKTCVDENTLSMIQMWIGVLTSEYESENNKEMARKFAIALINQAQKFEIKNDNLRPEEKKKILLNSVANIKSELMFALKCNYYDDDFEGKLRFLFNNLTFLEKLTESDNLKILSELINLNNTTIKEVIRNALREYYSENSFDLDLLISLDNLISSGNSTDLKKLANSEAKLPIKEIIFRAIYDCCLEYEHTYQKLVRDIPSIKHRK